MAELAAQVSAAILKREERRSNARSWWGRALREPFLHFIVLGGLLFALNEYLEARATFTRITLTREEVAGIIDNHRLQYGYTPTGSKLDELINQYIREQVFYHEALRIGLDKNDEIVRRRLVQKYEFLQQDLAVDSEPTDAQLRAYFQAHAAHYLLAPKIAFTQVYFSTDQRGEEGARAAAQKARAELIAQGVDRAATNGDAFPGPTDYAALTHDDVARVFGATGLAEQVFTLPVGQWSEPLRSGLGWHLVYVTSQQAGRPARFEDVRSVVRQDWLDSERERRNEAAFDKLVRHFTIVRE